MNRIGHYEVGRELGRGGMGVVHLARDTRLDRDVAIKALPPEFAADADRMARFEREAKTLAQLNHANIAGILGIEEQDGKKYLVLEYVGGETLAERLDRGPLPIDEALPIAIEIAAGIEAAHEAGIVHRDLKPDNVKLTADGKVKVLDFGLARTAESNSDSAAADAATLTSPTPQSPTIPGAILGTAPYMSPEQARGRPVDRRTDIWSFGVVLYEMLTGASPFVGETASDSIGAVLHKQIELDRLPAETPPAVRHVLWRCLQRSRDRRNRDIGDVRIELQAAAEGGGAPWATASAAQPRPARTVAWVLATALVAVAAVVGFARSRAEQTAPRLPGPAHFVVDLGDESDRQFRPALSADGRRMLVEGTWNAQPCVIVRDLEDPVARPIPGTRFASSLAAISPDGQWVCFMAGGTYRKAPIDGGPSVPICTVPNGRGCAWSPDGTIIVSVDRVGPLHRVSENGGEPVPMYEMAEAARLSDRVPALLPGGKGVLFDRTRDGAEWDECSVMVVPLAGGPPRELVRGARFGRYLHTGHLVYQREDTLMAVGFDLDELVVTTREAPVLRGLSTARTGGGGPPRFDLAANGTLVYLRGGSDVRREQKLARVSLQGEWSELSKRTGTFEGIWPSNDGRFLAVTVAESTGEPQGISILDLERGLLRPLSGASGRRLNHIVWYPDGQSILCTPTTEADGAELVRYRVGGVAEAEAVATGDQPVWPQDWTADGRMLLASRAGDTDIDLVLFRFDEQGRLSTPEPQVFLDWPGNQACASFSPRDDWVLFTSIDRGAQIFVAPLDDPARSVQISIDGGNFACWAPDRDRIYFIDDRSAHRTVYAVDFTVGEGGEFKPNPAEALFDLKDADKLYTLSMTRDGRSFLIPKPVGAVEASTRPELHVVLQWGEAIRDLLPVPE